MSKKLSAVSGRRSANGHQQTATSYPLTTIRAPRAGFTLVELLAVITIVTLLAALVVGGASFALRKASVARCQAQMEVIKNALSDYKLEKGRYPSDANPYQDLKPFLKDTTFVRGWPSSGSAKWLVDPWGNHYWYEAPPFGQPVPPTMHNKASFDLWSYGPNGQDDSSNPDRSDDINNWSSGR